MSLNLNINKIIKDYGVKVISGIGFISYIVVLIQVYIFEMYKITNDWIHCLFVISSVIFILLFSKSIYIFLHSSVADFFMKIQRNKKNFESILSDLNSPEYHKNNEAMSDIENNKIDIKKLSSKQKRGLGESILSAFINGSYEAENFIKSLEWKIKDISKNILEGVLLRCFVNKKDKLSFLVETKALNTILFAVQNHAKKESIANFVSKKISKAKFDLHYGMGFNSYMKRLKQKQFDYTDKIILKINEIFKKNNAEGK